MRDTKIFNNEKNVLYGIEKHIKITCDLPDDMKDLKANLQ